MNRHPWFSVASVGTLAAFASVALAGQPDIRMIYLVPTDRPVRADYVLGMQKAIQHLQRWYRDHMPSARTFTLHDPIVEVHRTSHEASWYSTQPAGLPSLWFWNNVTSEGFALTGGQFFDTDDIWLLYIDAQPACGQATGGTSSVALLPRNDLRGLVGEPNIPPCTGAPPDTLGVCRWVGGLGHELGHALGLPHPPGCEDTDPGTACPSSTLMWLGYTIYPFTALQPADIALLDQSAFFSRQTPAAGPFGCTSLVLAGDLNDDHLVNGVDLGMLLAAWSIPPGSPGCGGALVCGADLNHDGVVDGLDLALMLAAWHAQS